jgi:glycosyltransferase involved in cell wall biosynthesis
VQRGGDGGPVDDAGNAADPLVAGPRVRDPRVSVVVCSRNRARLLDRCLASLAGCSGLDEAEVIVVDNGSTDGTPAVAERWSSALPLRYEREPRTGLSNARNRALEVARSEVIAFLDDDVLVEPVWLRATWDAFAESPDVGGVAGRVRLQWPEGRPSWLPESREVWFARLDLGDDARPLTDRECPVGANMAVRRAAAAAAGGFDPGLGYAGSRLLGNEEVDFFSRVRRAGFAVAYAPAMAVDHVVEGDRVSRRYLLRRVYSQGRSDVRMEARDGAVAAAGERAREALSRATVRGWRNDVRRLRRPGGWERNLVDVLAGRAKQLGRAREWAAVRGGGGDGGQA